MLSQTFLRYRKTILAYQLDAPFELATELGVMRGEPGDYVCVDKEHIWVAERLRFEAEYEFQPGPAHVEDCRVRVLEVARST